jgi:hypothetical protein
MSWDSLFQSPIKTAIKKNMFAILKDRYPKHDDFLERIAALLQTKQDIESFNALVADLYEIGYIKSTEDHREILKKLGYNVKIVPQEQAPQKESNTIFPQEKSG